MSDVVSAGVFSQDADTPILLDHHTLERPPIKLMFSLIGACNLDCFHCAGPRKNPTTPSLALIEWVVANVMPQVRAIRLGGNDNTEQFLSPKFLYFLDRTRDLSPQHYDTVTNLTVMSEAIASAIASQLTQLEISIEGTDERFERIRGFSWRRFSEHLSVVEAARAGTSGSRLKLSLLFCSLLDTLEDALQIERFRDWGVDKIVLREFRPHPKPGHQAQKLSNDPERVARFIDQFKSECVKHGMDYYIGFEKKYAAQELKWVDSSQDEKQVGYSTCHLPWEVLSISHTGQISGCCTYPFWSEPDLHAKAINEVWNSENLKNLRRTVNSDTPNNICKRCELKVRDLSDEQLRVLS